MNGIVIGRRRQGKSTLALRLCLTYHKTVFIWDPNNQFNNLPAVDDVGELLEWIDDKDIEHGVMRFRPRPGMMDEDFDDFVEAIWGLGNYAILVDEAGSVQRPQALHPQLERLMRQAPTDNARNERGELVDVTVIQTVHRPSDLQSLCRSLATNTFLFQAQLRRDLDVIRAQYGDEVAAVLPTLQRWHVCHTYSHLDGRQYYTTWSNPADWYTPIGVTGPSTAR